VLSFNIEHLKKKVLIKLAYVLRHSCYSFLLLNRPGKGRYGFEDGNCKHKGSVKYAEAYALYIDF
jgi:hypothetical protein